MSAPASRAASVQFVSQKHEHVTRSSELQETTVGGSVGAVVGLAATLRAEPKSNNPEFKHVTNQIMNGVSQQRINPFEVEEETRKTSRLTTQEPSHC